jgi:hypothetical protein
MAKEEKKIEPVVSQVQSPLETFVPKDGHYHMIRVDKDGKEIEGSDFSIGQRSYEKAYQNNPLFKVKKNPK